MLVEAPHVQRRSDRRRALAQPRRCWREGGIISWLAPVAACLYSIQNFCDSTKTRIETTICHLLKRSYIYPQPIYLLYIQPSTVQRSIYRARVPACAI